MENKGRGDFVMKKVIWTMVLVIALVVSGTAWFSLFYLKKAHEPNGAKEGDLIPIEKITGINISAKLRDGYHVTKGISMPYDDNGPWLHSGRMAGLEDMIEGGSGKNEGLPVKNIRIIDVYKDKCTITFMCADDNKRYYTTDFPLAFLKYDKSKAEKADDGIETSLPGSRFTLASDTSNVKLAVILIVSHGVTAVSIIFLCKKEKKHE